MSLLLCTLVGCSTFSGSVDTGPRRTVPEDSTEVVVKWTPPVDGAPVVYYVMDWAHVQSDTVLTTRVRVRIPLRRTRVRVAGVDSLARQGPWSLWSDWKPEPPEDDLHEDTTSLP